MALQSSTVSLGARSVGFLKSYEAAEAVGQKVDHDLVSVPG